MIWIDYSIIALVLGSVVIGLFKGLKRQVFSLSAWLVAALVGIFFSLDFAWLLSHAIADPMARMAAAFICLCVITQGVAGLIGLLLGGVLTSGPPSLIGRLTGMILGMAHGGLFVTLAVLLAGLSVLPKTPWWHQSKLLPPFQMASAWISGHLQSEFTQNIHY